jgi:hypothetical protein
MFKTMRIAGKDIKLRYGIKALITIEKEAGKVISDTVFDILVKNSKLPLSKKDKIPLEACQILIDIDMEAMLWMFGLGLDWSESGAKPKDAADLFDAYMGDGELDTGERLTEFRMTIQEAIGMARGIDHRKNLKKQQEEHEKKIAEQKAEAVARAEAGIGVGLQKSESVS